MLIRKQYLFIPLTVILGCAMANSGLARGLSPEDYLCSIFPPNCPKVKKSTSMEHVRLTLSSEFGERKLDIPPRLVTFEFPRAYVSWGPSLKDKHLNSFAIRAALPDLLPHALWKQQMLDKGKSTGKSIEEMKKLDFDLHKNWLPIDLQIYSQKYNTCYRKKCFDSNVALDRFSRLEWHPKLLKEDNDFKYYVASGVKKARKSYEAVLIPKKMDPGRHFVMTCDINISTTYNWCKARSMLDKNIALGYWFEVKHLDHFYDLDKKIRNFVKSAIVKDTRANL
ncbi:MAG: hypothetical protein ACWGOV_11960 [Acidiferrobacterales bacterium]